jgi:hypothetical protein
MASTLTEGKWSTSALPLPANADSNRVSQLDVVDCPASGTCYAGGYYVAANEASQGLLATWSNGSWTSRMAPIDAEANRDPGVIIFELSCPTVDWCAAASPVYSTKSGPGRMLVDVLSNGTWTAQTVTAPQLEVGESTGGPDLGALSCAAPGWCVLLGSYRIVNDPLGTGVVIIGPFVAVLSNGTWTSRQAPLPLDAAVGPGAANPMALVCTAINDCVGDYLYFTVRDGWSGGFLSMPEVPLPPVLTATVQSGGAALALTYNVAGQADALHPLGGRMAGAPVVVAIPAGAGQLSPLFVGTGLDHSLNVRTLSAGWQRVKGAGSCTGQPGAAAYGRMLFLACMGADHQLYGGTAAVTSSGTVGATQWRALGGYLTGSPVIALAGAGATFVVPGKNGALYQRTLAHGFTQMPISCSGQPAAATSPDRARTYIACANSSGNLLTWSSDGERWSGPINHGGVVVGQPAVLANSQSVSFVAQGTDHAAWAWTAGHWKRYGGNASAGVAAAGLN